MCNDFISVRTWNKQITDECVICLCQIWASPKRNWLFSQTELSFSASFDSGRRRIVCKERFPPTDHRLCHSAVGRCSASPRSAPRWPLGPLGHNWWWWCTIDGVKVWKDQIIIIIVILLIFVTTWPIVFFFQMFSIMQWWSMQKREAVWLFALGGLLL